MLVPLSAYHQSLFTLEIIIVKNGEISIDNTGNKLLTKNYNHKKSGEISVGNQGNRCHGLLAEAYHWSLSALSARDRRAQKKRVILLLGKGFLGFLFYKILTEFM